MQKNSMLGLLIAFSIVNCDARQKVDMSRIYAAREQTKKEFSQELKDKRKEALNNLWATQEGRIYKQKIGNDNIRKGSDFYNQPDIVQAEKNLVATQEYQKEFLPIEKEYTYHNLKLFGFNKMTRYVDAKVGRSDEEALRSGLHSALYVDTVLHKDLRQTRSDVYTELSELIRQSAGGCHPIIPFLASVGAVVVVGVLRK